MFNRFNFTDFLGGEQTIISTDDFFTSADVIDIVKPTQQKWLWWCLTHIMASGYLTRTHVSFLNYPTIWLSMILVFGNNQVNFYRIMSVLLLLFTYVQAEEGILRFPTYDCTVEMKYVHSKSASKIWCNCVFQFVIKLGFKYVVGHSCLFFSSYSYCRTRLCYCYWYQYS